MGNNYANPNPPTTWFQSLISQRLLNRFLKMKVFWNQEEKGYHLEHKKVQKNSL